MASLTRWTWVWVNYRSWWWTGRPGMLRFIGLQRVGYDWVTELNWTFQVPMQYCSLQHQTLLPSPVTSTTGCCFCFSSVSCWEPTHETLPMTRPWGRKPEGQGGSGFQGFQKGQLMRSHPWQGHEEKVWQARQIRFSGILKSCPGAHLKDDICLSDACLNGLLSNFSDTGRRPSLISFQIRINLEL